LLRSFIDPAGVYLQLYILRMLKNNKHIISIAIATIIIVVVIIIPATGGGGIL